jgi:UDP-glucose 4-epimerase
VPIFIHRALKNKTIAIYGDGNQTRDLTYVKDIVAANAFFAMESPATGVFNMACGNSITINDLCAMICKLTGSKSEVVHTAERAGDIKYSMSNVGKIQAAGFVQTINIANGLQATVGFFKQKVRT